MTLDGEDFRGPDPKAAPRVKDRKATTRATVGRECVAGCGQRAANGHHVIGKGQGGDDVVENVAPLCGSGSSGCHGAFHGTPYKDAAGHRWTKAEVSAAVGSWIVTSPPVLAYVLGKLGDTKGRAFIRRVYKTEVPS